MAAFIPVIIVVGRKSFFAAFDACIELWAQNAKNAAVFIIIGALLLLLPEILRIIISDISLNQWGWEKRTADLFLSCFKVATGTLIMCSMVVFCRKVLEDGTGSADNIEETA